mgnify:CR=1 FL=1
MIFRIWLFTFIPLSYFYPPTIIADVKEGVKIVDEEQFGPALPIIKYSVIPIFASLRVYLLFLLNEEALERANATDFGLGGSVWSSDLQKANELGDRMITGTVWINDHLSETGAPFGGFKQSGLGRELGKVLPPWNLKYIYIYIYILLLPTTL